MNINHNRRELIEKIATNRAKHKEQHTEAHKTWTEQAIKKLKGCVKKLEDGKSIGSTRSIMYDLEEPSSYLKEYDNVLELLRASDDENIAMQPHDYEHYVRDNWHWKQSFQETHSKYTNS